MNGWYVLRVFMTLPSNLSAHVILLMYEDTVSGTNFFTSYHAHLTYEFWCKKSLIFTESTSIMAPAFDEVETI